MQAVADGLRHGKKLSVTVKLDGLDRGIVHHLAVSAFTDVLVQDVLQFFRQIAIEVGRDLFKCFFAGQASLSIEGFAQFLA